LKLGKRLKKIESMVTSEYTHIWDCCCDHGLLGAALLSRQAALYIHFVDIVPELMSELEDKLQRFHPKELSATGTQWQTHCIDVTALPLRQYEGKHLVIITGVGGDLVTQFVKAIYQSHPTTNIDFLLCPVQHQFTLRQQLIQLDFCLQAEALVEENQRFYEILIVSVATDMNKQRPKVSTVGNLIWETDTVEQAKNAVNYLTKTLNHYQRIQLGNNAGVKHIVEAYQSVII
jgi:tRNA (adenine22-N1)-methyltransferase